MKVSKLLLGILLFSIVPFSWGGPQSVNYKIKVSHGPFTNKLSLSKLQQSYSPEWKNTMSEQLAEKVNYAGHYRLYVGYREDLPNECGVGRPLCGWVIDKVTGQVVSELPEIISSANDMSHPRAAEGCAVYSGGDNDPPPSGAMADFPIFYDNSSLLWMNGTLSPAPNPDDSKCDYKIYNFTAGKFQQVGSGDPTDDPSFPRTETGEE